MTDRSNQVQLVTFCHKPGHIARSGIKMEREKKYFFLKKHETRGIFSHWYKLYHAIEYWRPKWRKTFRPGWILILWHQLNTDVRGTIAKMWSTRCYSLMDKLLPIKKRQHQPRHPTMKHIIWTMSTQSFNLFRFTFGIHFEKLNPGRLI